MVGGSIKSYLLKRVSTVRIRPGAPEEYRARYRYGAGLFWSKGRIRTVDTRVTNFPAGGVFESAWGAPEEYRARYRYGAGLFWSKGRIRAVDTRVTNFPAGGVFESAWGGTRGISSPVPLRCRALLVQCHVKSEAPACWGSKRAPVSEYVCGESRDERWGGD